MDGLSLVIPAWNEEAGIRRAIAEADEALAALAPLVPDYEILVVDDGSSDATADLILRECAGRPRVRLLRHETNCGYGAALRTGFEAARFERVAFTDADCQFHLTDLVRLLPLSRTHPVVVGYRIDRQDSWRRRFLSRGYNLLTRTLLGTRVRDCDCALKIFHRDALPALLPESEGFFVNTEMLTRARQQGLAVAEVGVRHRPRLHGKSSVSLREVPRTLGRLLPFWWMEVMFPGASSAPSPPTPLPQPHAPMCTRARRGRGEQAWLPAVVLLVLACVLFLGRLDAPLLEPQESRYAEIPRQMLVEGRLIVPVLHGEPYLDKPPLLYWLVMAAYRVFGVADSSARLVPGLAGVLTVLIVFLWGRRAVGARAAFCGALVLCLSAEFIYRQRMLTFDAVLGLWVTAGLAAGHRALQSGRLLRGWWLLSAGWCGLGLLTKGPVALVLIGVPLGILVFLDRRSARVSLLGWLSYLTAALLTASPWFVAVAVREPEFLRYFFWKHNVVRFVAPFDHARPAWDYLPHLVLGLLPWTLLLPGFFRFLVRRSARAGQRRSPALGFFLLCACTGLLFFSASGCKRPTYLLPVLPPLALALGCYLNVRLPRGFRAGAWTSLLSRSTPLATDAAALALTMGLALALLAGARAMVTPFTTVVLACSALLGLAALLSRRRQASWAVSASVTAGVLVSGILVLLPAYNTQFALRDALRQPPEDVPIFCYPQRWDSVTFYLPGADVRAYARDQRDRLLLDLKQHPDALLLVKTGLLKELLEALPPSVDFRANGRPGAVTIGRLRVHREPPAVLASR
jgi:dolichol-phosphate mannosyltransferase